MAELKKLERRLAGFKGKGKDFADTLRAALEPLVRVGPRSTPGDAAPAAGDRLRTVSGGEVLEELVAALGARKAPLRALLRQPSPASADAGLDPRRGRRRG